VGDLLEDVLEHLGAPLLITDLDGRIRKVNGAARDLFQGENDVLISRRLGEVLPKEIGEAVLKRLPFLSQAGRLRFDGQVVDRRGWKGDYHFEIFLVPREGEDLAVLLLREAAGREKASNEVLLRSFLDLAFDGVNRVAFLFERGGRIRRILPDEGQGAAFPLDVVKNEFLSGVFLRTLGEAWKGQSFALTLPCAINSKMYSPGSARFPLFLRFEGFPMPADWPQQILVLVEDVSSEHLVQEKDRWRTQQTSSALFASALLEEFNQFLGEILAQAAALRLSAPPGRLPSPPVGAITEAADQASQWLNRYLALGESVPQEWGQVDINRTVAEASERLRFLAGPDLQASLDLREGLPAVLGDPILLSHAFAGLGLLFWEENHPKELRFLTRLADAHQARGGGEVRVHILAPGGRADPAWISPKPEVLFPEGLGDKRKGLLLAFCRAMVRKHGGICRLAEEEGAVLWRIALPSSSHGPGSSEERPLSLVVGEEELEAEEGGEVLNKPRVLFVDDEEAIREVARQALAKEFHTILAADGKEAYEIFRDASRRFDIVIMDTYMPRLGGLEAYLRMQVYQPQLPVIFISGFVREASRSALLGACPGRTQVLIKPFRCQDLTEAVRKGLGLSEE
jgi:CheY-like chemotaxis protein